MNQALTFTTPARHRDPRTITVDLCGETLHIDRPKDATLYFAQQVLGDTVSDGDRAQAILQFLEGTLSPVDRKRFYDRILTFDDPVDLDVAIQLMNGLVERWNDWSKAPTGELVITSNYAPPENSSIPIHQEALNLEVVAHPPKDIVRLIASASMATGATPGQQAWAVSLFLDAALDPADSVMVARRMRDQDDGLDIEHVAEIVHDLIKRWTTNREQRRAHN